MATTGDEQAYRSYNGAGANVGGKKMRTRSGCLNCRRRRRKCDEARPTCLNCLKRNEDCERGVRLTFRAENAHTLSEDETVSRLRKRPRRYEIKDVTSDVIDQYHTYSPTIDLNSPSIPPTDTIENRGRDIVHYGVESSRRQTTTGDVSAPTSKDSGLSYVSTNALDTVSVPESRVLNNGNGLRQIHETERLTSQYHSLQRDIPDLSSTGVSEAYSMPNPQTESAAENLLFLRNIHQQGEPALPVSSTVRDDDAVESPTFSSPINQITPDSLFDDGVFLPGSTYRELHTTLRQHLIDETNPTSNYRQYPRIHGSSEADWLEQQQSLSPHVNEAVNEAIDDGASYSGQTPPMELSPEEEFRLWKNWIDEIACWLDKFDNHRHFQHTLPVMAKTCDHLRFSMLAVSARQIELKNAFQPTDQSLALYQQAIHLLVPQLHTRTTAVIASCVVLCVLEMLSCSPKAWRRHLDGCANLIQAVGITGFSGGVEQALFWCFARMDVCGGLIDSMKTLIPVGQWASGIDLDADIEKFRAQADFDGYANHAVYLCARVVELLSYGCAKWSKNDEKSFIYRWSKLWEYVEDWKTRRPAEMHPVTTIKQPKLTPFPTVLYSNPAATSGNQLFHTASILMLQHKPAALKLDHKPLPVQWHARQICGISLSNDHHGAWTNSIQPLWIAGRCMSKPEEHAAILEHLQKIELESGWGTKWRMEDLREYWEIEYG